MAEKKSKVSELHAAARKRLQEFLLASVGETGEGLPPDVRTAIDTVINCRRKTYRYMLFVGLLVAVTDRRFHPRCLQLKARELLAEIGKEAFDARSLCKQIVVPFEKDLLKGRIGASCDPYVSNPARLPMVEPGNDVKSAYDRQLLGQLYDVLENVAALARLVRFANVRERLLEGYARIGYAVRFEVLDSQYYSTPQRRERLIMIGTTDRVDNIAFPARATGRIPARDVLLGFDAAGAGNNANVCEARITLARNPVLRKSPYAGMLFNGMGRPIDLDSPCQTLPASMGGNKTPFIDTRRLRDPGARDWLAGVHRKAMRGEDISRCKVPDYVRRITVDEAAALQGFPVGYRFAGSRCDQYRQIGNSVPPPFAYHIAKAVTESFSRKP